MPLVLMPINGAGPNRFRVYEGERKIGRIYKAEGDYWFWGIDWFAIGQKLLAKHAGTREEAIADLKAMWDLVIRTGVEKIGKSHASTRDEALDKFTAAWGYVTGAGKAATGDDPI